METATSPALPTVVFVHGAFADASGWADVITRLRSDGLSALAPPNPLRGLASDAAYIAARVRQIAGPALLVGHSYGGAVITVAGAVAENVVGLVDVAAAIPDEGESLGDVNGRFPAGEAVAHFRQNTYPLDDGEAAAVELTIAPEAYPRVFAPSLAPDAAAAAALSQRPLAASAVVADRAEAAAWKTRPSWAIVARDDRVIHPDAERATAARAGAVTIEIDGPHTLMLSHPGAVADQIRSAASTCLLVASGAAGSPAAGARGRRR